MKGRERDRDKEREKANLQKDRDWHKTKIHRLKKKKV